MAKMVRYGHGGGRLFIDGEAGRRNLIADFYEEADREFYYHARADIPWLLDQLASVSTALSNCKKENELLRASVPSTASGPTGSPRSPQPDGAARPADIVRVMIDRCVDRSCEGGDSDSAQAASSEQCRDYYGASRVDEWCDMCLFNEAIKRLQASHGKAASDEMMSGECPTCGADLRGSFPLCIDCQVVKALKRGE